MHWRPEHSIKYPPNRRGGERTRAGQVTGAHDGRQHGWKQPVQDVGLGEVGAVVVREERQELEDQVPCRHVRAAGLVLHDLIDPTEPRRQKLVCVQGQLASDQKECRAGVIEAVLHRSFGRFEEGVVDGVALVCFQQLCRVLHELQNIAQRLSRNFTDLWLLTWLSETSRLA
jgi:hypothetical protein